MIVKRHAPEQRSEELDPDPQKWLEHVVGCSFRDFADHHLWVSRWCKLQLDEPRRGREGDEVDGLAGSFEKVLCDGKDHPIVNVGGQIELAFQQFLSAVFVGFSFTRYFPEARSSEISVSSVNAGPRCCSR